MRQLQTTVVLRFWAEYPDDDLDSDDRADHICDSITEATNQLPYVSEGSASVQDFDTSEA